jgi:hypothetical protein
MDHAALVVGRSWRRRKLLETGRRVRFCRLQRAVRFDSDHC